MAKPSNDVKKYIQDFINLPPNATHDDIRYRLANLLEAILDSWARSQLPYDSDIPDIVLFDKATGIDFLIVEVKTGRSRNRAELESKSGARKGEKAVEQLERYLKAAALTWGLLADLDRLELYRYDEKQGKLVHEMEIEFTGRSVDDIHEDLVRMRKLILIRTVPPPTKVKSPVSYAMGLKDKAILVKEVLLKLYNALIRHDIKIEEYELIKKILPAVITEEDFVSKTVAALLAKITLAFNSGLSARIAVTSPELVRELARNGEIGYLSYFMWIQDYMATKYPQVFKSDIDLFNWWTPYSSRYESTIRSALKDVFVSLNLRLRAVIDYVMRYKPPRGKDVLGIVYQLIRTEHEQSILGAYYTSYELVRFVIDALEVFIEKANRKGYTDLSVKGLYLDPRIKVLDPACGSGSFLAGIIERALDYGAKKDGAEKGFKGEEVASRLVSKIHGIDVDPLAVLIARTEIFMLLSPHLVPPFDVNVYWGDSLKLAEAVRESKARTLLDYLVPGAKDYAIEIRAPIRELDNEIKKAYTIVKDGVHILVGNPPWGRRSELKKRLRSLLVRLGHPDPESAAEDYVNRIVSVEGLREKYFSGRDDNVFIPFVVQVSGMLKPGGILAMLVDARFVASEWGKQFIEFLRREFSYVRVLDVSRENLFIKATSYPALVLAVKS